VRRLLPVVVAVAALAGACVPPAGSGARYIDPVFGDVSVLRDVVYGEAPGKDGSLEQLTLDLYRPRGDTETSRPVVIWVHGGGFRTGDKGWMSLYARAFAERGYVSASINYRLLNDAESEEGGNIEAVIAAKRDAQAAVRWFRRYADAFRIDPDRISIGGSSAGAVTSLAVALIGEDVGDSGNPGFSSRVCSAVSISGALGESPELLVTEDDANALFFHGTADPRVPYERARKLEAAMRQAGIFTSFTTYEGAGHSIVTDFRDDIIQRTASVLYLTTVTRQIPCPV
jgi:para-nitrobenzyl esterase